MRVVTDLHLHSKYSRAVSPAMNLESIAQMAVKKGIDLLATSDWMHPLWLSELRQKLEESEEGVYRLQKESSSVRFLLATEVACIYSQGGRGRRIHHLIFVPNLLIAQRVNEELIARGCTLSADGRPIIGLSSKDLLQLLLEIDERCLLIPAHVWTPWFGVYGKMSGFDSLTECFEELTPFVYGIETGLSSDPEMNWRMEELEHRSILSFSDAHSLAKMGRELTVFDLEKMTYPCLREAIINPAVKNKIEFTVEFYPEEGKYHYSGHRACHFFFKPEEEVQAKGLCPVCHRPVTDGVMRRVEELATMQSNAVIEDASSVVRYADPTKTHPPFVKLVPLNEIIAQVLSRPATSLKTKELFDQLVDRFGSEFLVLLHVPLDAIEKAGTPVVREAIERVRKGNILIQPGFDGQYGKVTIWPDSKEKISSLSDTQMGFDW